MSSAPSSLASGAPQRGRGGLSAWAIILGVLLIAVIVVIALTLRGLLPFGPAASAQADAAPTTLTLEPADSMGNNPFSSQPLASTVTALPASVATATTPVASGSTPGLYGGSNDIGVCKIDQLVSFLQANPDKAAAWLAVFNGDPTLQWPYGALTVADIPKYISTLTAVVLTSSTRVTNHGFADGTFTTLQSVLEAGTAVLVDANKVPRVKCKCGNPLTPPIAIIPPPDPGLPPGGGTSESPSPSPTCIEPPFPVPDGGSVSACDSPPVVDVPPPDTTSDCAEQIAAGAFECADSATIDDSLGTVDITTMTEITPTLTVEPTLTLKNTDTGALTDVIPGCSGLGQCPGIDPSLNAQVLAAIASGAQPAASSSASPSPSAAPSPSASASPVANPTPPSGAPCGAFLGDNTRYDGTFTNNSGAYVYVWFIGQNDQGCAPSFVSAVNSSGGYTNVYGTPGSAFTVTDENGTILQNYTVGNSSPAFTYP